MEEKRKYFTWNPKVHELHFCVCGAILLKKKKRFGNLSCVRKLVIAADVAGFMAAVLDSGISPAVSMYVVIPKTFNISQRFVRLCGLKIAAGVSSGNQFTLRLSSFSHHLVSSFGCLAASVS